MRHSLKERVGGSNKETSKNTNLGDRGSTNNESRLGKDLICTSSLGAWQGDIGAHATAQGEKNT